MKTIHLPTHMAAELIAHAGQNPEQEVCGLISGRGGRPLRIYRIHNVAADPARRFTMDPREQIDALRRMREQGHELFAIYHSHPHGPPLPSALDLEQAAYPDALYLIVAPEPCGSVMQLKGYFLRSREDIEEVKLKNG